MLLTNWYLSGDQKLGWIKCGLNLHSISSIMHRVWGMVSYSWLWLNNCQLVQLPDTNYSKIESTVLFRQISQKIPSWEDGTKTLQTKHGAAAISQLTGFCFLLWHLILSLKTSLHVRWSTRGNVCKWECVHRLSSCCLSLLPVCVRLCVCVWLHACRKTRKGVGVTGQHLEKAHAPQR